MSHLSWGASLFVVLSYALFVWFMVRNEKLPDEEKMNGAGVAVVAAAAGAIATLLAVCVRIFYYGSVYPF